MPRANTITLLAGVAILPVSPVIRAEVPACGGQGGQGADVLCWEGTTNMSSIYNCMHHALWLC